MAGTEIPARQQAAQLKKRLQVLQSNIPKPQIKLFFQLWQKPLMTVGAASSLQQIFQLCGYRNIFAEVQRSAFSVDLETVFMRNPQLIIASITPAQQNSTQAYWRHFPAISAVANERIFMIDPDITQRPTARQFDAAEYLCDLHKHIAHDFSVDASRLKNKASSSRKMTPALMAESARLNAGQDQLP